MRLQKDRGTVLSTETKTELRTHTTIKQQQSDSHQHTLLRDNFKQQWSQLPKQKAQIC